MAARQVMGAGEPDRDVRHHDRGGEARGDHAGEAMEEARAQRRGEGDRQGGRQAQLRQIGRGHHQPLTFCTTRPPSHRFSSAIANHMVACDAASTARS